MKLRDLRYASAPSWPPTWRRWPGAGAAPGPLDGSLAAVRLRPGADGLVIDRLFAGERQEGWLLWEGRPDAATLLDLLTPAMGRPIAELEAVEI